MDSYTFALALGGAGLVAMAAFGVSRGGDTGGSHGLGHSGHSGSALPSGGRAHGVAGHVAAHGHAHAHAPSFGSRVGSQILAIASPRSIFSLLVGFGLVGLALKRVIPAPFVLAAAIAGGIFFEIALVRPVWRALFRFASSPAITLESAILTEATAASGFDANGHGLVAIEVDGQIVQCLGTLAEVDRQLGVRVRSGDRLRVESIDATRGRCAVSFVGHGESSSSHTT